MIPANWPREVERGLIPTDNAMGVMTSELSPAAEDFVAHARDARRPLLEVGAAYGNATLPALAAGATVIANDLSSSELAVLASSAPPRIDADWCWFRRVFPPNFGSATAASAAFSPPRCSIF
jgi:hypothetical protein